MLKRTIHEQVADELRKELLNGEIQPGKRIIESDVASRLGVSRGPVREALRQLSKEGYVTYMPNKGCQASLFSDDEVKEAYLLRFNFECLAVQIYNGKMSRKYLDELKRATNQLYRATRNRSVYETIEADERFHRIIVKAAGRRKLLEMWDLLACVNISSFYFKDSKNSLSYEEIKNNHIKMLELFEDGAEVDVIIKKLNEHYRVRPEELFGENVE